MTFVTKNILHTMSYCYKITLDIMGTMHIIIVNNKQITPTNGDEPIRRAS